MKQLILNRKIIMASLASTPLLLSLNLEAGTINYSEQVIGTTIQSTAVMNPVFQSETCTRYYTLPDYTTGSQIMPATVLLQIPPSIHLGFTRMDSPNQPSGTHSSYVVCPISGTLNTVTTVVP